MSFDQQNGFKAKVRHEHFECFKNTYQDMGYKINDQDQWSTLTCDASTFSQNPTAFRSFICAENIWSNPKLTHRRTFFWEICLFSMYYLSNCLLPGNARYFPTHWISLIQGERGDALWPTINRAQQFVENSYPELVVEMIFDMIYENEKKSND